MTEPNEAENLNKSSKYENLINSEKQNMLTRSRIRLLSSSLESWIQISHGNSHNILLLTSLNIAKNTLKGNHEWIEKQDQSVNFLKLTYKWEKKNAMLPPNHFNKQILAQWLLYLDSKGISQELEYIIDNVSIINLQGKGNRKKKGKTTT